jgi:tetratricopeptide (TPR) repeat protein
MHGIVSTDDLPERIVGYLQAASSAMGDWREAESLLLRAQAVEPNCLHVYYTLYKLYFKNNRLSDADRTINLALDQASKQAGIAADWHLLTTQSCDWSEIDSPQHFYLFSLKALAFVRLRQACVMDANQILAKLREMDPQDSVGASVIEAYSVGAMA